MSQSDIIITILIGALLFFAVRKLIRDRKKGASCPSCSGCPIAGQCKESS